MALAHDLSNRNITKIFAWGADNSGGKIDESVQAKMVTNVITSIFSSKRSFMALSNDGNIYIWGSYGTRSSDLQRIQTVIKLPEDIQADSVTDIQLKSRTTIKVRYNKNDSRVIKISN